MMSDERGCHVTVCTIYSCENLTAGWFLFQNDLKQKTMVNICLATHLNLVYEWKSNITNKTNRQTQKLKQTHLQTSAAHHVSCVNCPKSMVLSRGFMVMKSQNGLDRSRDQLNGQHGSSRCAVEYDEFDESLNSKVGSVVKVPL